MKHSNWTVDNPLVSSSSSAESMDSLSPTFDDTTAINGTSDLFCPAVRDKVSTWPPTLAGTIAVIPCFSELNNVKYDTSGNATRHCLLNSTWEYPSNYSNCKPLIQNHQTFDVLEEYDSTNQMTMLIYYVGFSISLACLFVALTIFLCFKDLRCVRNTFHANLMLTYVLVDLTWIIMASSQHRVDDQSVTCILLILLYYFKGTNFFWMFVEGFYLYMLVVNTFTVEKIKFPVYMIIGWGIPAVIVLVWGSLKAHLLQRKEHRSIIHTDEEEKNGQVGCPWFVEHAYDWIFNIPILLVLTLNMLFLLRIMWVLITKLRASTSAESQQYRPMLPPTSPSHQECSRNYNVSRKAAKALLILIPLLGVTYMLVIASPKKGLSATVIAYIRSILISTQGMTVSILYCFLNGEVRNVLRHHWQRRYDRRALGQSSQHSLRYFSQASVKSRTESIRLSSRCHDKGRESCTSCVTSTSYVGTDGVPSVIVQLSPSPLTK